MKVALLNLIIAVSFSISSLFAANSEILKRSQKIDQLLDKGYKEYEVKASPIIDDATFLRRTSLALTGRIPNLKEAQSFLNDRSSNKRAKFIEQAINSPGYVHHYYNFWADLLRVKNGSTNSIKGVTNNEYSDWITNSLRENKPYNQFVYELITATGRAEDNGAVGYYFRDEKNLLDTVGTTAQVFLANQIFCAQCHNHPFEDTTQLQYYEFAAHFSEVDDKPPREKRKKGGKDARMAMKNLRNSKLPEKQMNRIKRTARFKAKGNWEHKGKKLKLPKNYKYENGKAGQVVKAKLLDGSQLDLSKTSKRKAFAKWLISPENKRFAQTISNRLWQKAMGYGLFEPVDDFNEFTEVLHPEVLDYLATSLVELDYDLKKLLQVILNTKAFQRSIIEGKELTKRNYYAQAVKLERMSAEQVWDSLLTLISPKPDQFTNRLTNPDAPTYAELSKTLTKKNFSMKEFETLMRKAKSGRAAGMEMMMADMQNEKGKKRGKKDREFKQFQKDKMLKAMLIRSSEIAVPAKKGDSILSTFGQSNRDVVEHGSRDMSLQQALALMNSRISTLISTRYSTLTQNVTKHKTIDDKIKTVYLSILSRYPSHSELSKAKSMFKKNGLSAYGDLIWILLNSKEFLFIQ